MPGVEPWTWAAVQAHERGLHVVTGTLEDAALPKEYFDVVTMWDVIEQLTIRVPRRDVFHGILKPGGIFAIHTIDIESLFSRLMGKRWPWLMEMHLYYFSPRTLAKLLNQAGFEVIRSSAQGRFLRLGNLATRVEPYHRPLAKLLSSIVNRLGISGTAVPVILATSLRCTHARCEKHCTAKPTLGTLFRPAKARFGKVK